ncbi:MAG: hypothetical protein VXZ35_12245, partial [Pseudomonadota bacterium]|nr:hypothetical protein [Pseudomonadota bacterium]
MPIKSLFTLGLVLFATFSSSAQSQSCASRANTNYDYLNEAIDAYNRGARRFNDHEYGSAERSYRTARDRAKFAYDMWDRLSEHVYCY